MLPAISAGSRSPICFLVLDRQRAVFWSHHRPLTHFVGGHKLQNQNQLQHVRPTWKWSSFAGVNNAHFHVANDRRFKSCHPDLHFVTTLPPHLRVESRRPSPRHFAGTDALSALCTAESGLGPLRW